MADKQKGLLEKKKKQKNQTKAPVKPYLGLLNAVLWLISDVCQGCSNRKWYYLCNTDVVPGLNQISALL